MTDFLIERNRNVDSLQDINWSLWDMTFLIDDWRYEWYKFKIKSLFLIVLVEWKPQNEIFDYYKNNLKLQTYLIFILQLEKYYEIIQNLLEEFDKRVNNVSNHEKEFHLFSDPFSCDPQR